MKTKLVLLLLLASVFHGYIDSDYDRSTTVIKKVFVVDVIKGVIEKEPKDIFIKDDRIIGISNHGNENLDGYENSVDASGKYIIPGLWDMHAHPDDPEMWRMKINPESRDLLMPLFVLHGVTGIRDMAGSMDVVKYWRKRITDGELLGPEIIACGPLIDGPNPMWDGSVGIPDLSAVERIADSLVASGSDFLKVYSLLPDSTYFALSTYAQKKGIPITGHVPLTVTTSEASDSGLNSQEHLLNILYDCSTESEALYSNTLDYDGITDRLDRYVHKNKRMLDTYDEDRAEKLFKTFMKNGTYHTPTVSMWYKNAYFEEELKTDAALLKYLPNYMRTYWKPEVNDHLQNRHEKIISTKKRVVQKYREVIGAMHKAGVLLLAGTDVGANPLCFPGIGLHNELELLGECGISPAEVLKTATINPARYLKIDHDYGSVEVGKKADLVVLDENPLVSIRNTRKINSVIKSGKIYNSTNIKDKLEEIAMLQSNE